MSSSWIGKAKQHPPTHHNDVRTVIISMNGNPLMMYRTQNALDYFQTMLEFRVLGFRVLGLRTQNKN
jgi:hypothetical protein